MFKFLFKVFKKGKLSEKNEDSNGMKKYLIVGLGNIGAQYQSSRHNIGFQILDFLAQKEEVIFESQKLGDVATFKFKGRQFILLNLYEFERKIRSVLVKQREYPIGKPSCGY